MFEVRTEAQDGSSVVWQVSVPWQTRRDAVRGEGIVAAGDGAFVNVPGLEPLIVPDCVTGWDRDGEPTEEAIYSLPHQAQHMLCRQVGIWMIDGRLPGDESPLESA